MTPQQERETTFYAGRPNDQQLFEWQKHDPVYLLNDATMWGWGGGDLMELVGLAYQRETNEVNYYPLTEPEQQFVWPSEVVELGGGYLQTGYAVLYRGRKWVAPHLVYYFELANRSEATLRHAVAAARLKPLVEAVGGLVLPVRDELDDNDEPDRHELLLLLPAEMLVARFGTREPYRAWLFDLCGKAQP